MSAKYIAAAIVGLVCSGCLLDTGPSAGRYRLMWFCAMDSCERGNEVVAYDRAAIQQGDIEITSSSNSGLFADGQLAFSGTQGADCWLTFGLGFFGHKLEPSMYCKTAGGFELTVSIPDPDPATSSTWVIEGREI
ncbi:hypothetical protein Hoch_6682 [Haliangium ochraceum DSM 14365]|uniref:Uncharacterized protein n=1 Tax=Haliangium ochraceum (strain DSM 14365 / JCM 11303 / SMP-2) TaxID=502025 RepID=D0LT11_HALO1|nr:hypothetical protein Hoch_6682 [Haliangium ochraceum DSM 14365]